MSFGLMALVCTPLYAGCLDNSCKQISEEPVTYTDGTTNAARTSYTSATGDQTFLRFPAGRILRMEHGLLRKPDDYDVKVSYIADGGDHAFAAGNMALLNVNDSYLQVENDTCADVFVQVTAWLRTDPTTLPESSVTELAETDASLDAATTPPDAQPSTTGDAN